MHPDLQRLPDTRWACKTLMERLPAVLRLFHWIDMENSGEGSVAVSSLLRQVHLTFEEAFQQTKYYEGNAGSGLVLKVNSFKCGQSVV